MTPSSGARWSRPAPALVLALALALAAQHCSTVRAAPAWIPDMTMKFEYQLSKVFDVAKDFDPNVQVRRGTATRAGSAWELPPTACRAPREHQRPRRGGGARPIPRSKPAVLRFSGFAEMVLTAGPHGGARDVACCGPQPPRAPNHRRPAARARPRGPRQVYLLDCSDTPADAVAAIRAQGAHPIGYFRQAAARARAGPCFSA
jgi:hypothetical protein